MSALRAGRLPFTPRKGPGINICYMLSRTQSHNAAERIRSVEKFNDFIGNRSRDLPACSIVPQPTTLPRAPNVVVTLRGDRLCGLVVRVPGYRSRGPGFDSRCYKIFWEVVGLERGPLSLVRVIEELLEWKSSCSVLKSEINRCGDPLRWPRDTFYPQKLALISPTSGGRSVGIVRVRTESHGVNLVVLVQMGDALVEDEGQKYFHGLMFPGSARSFYY
jgi:hypothetical protein